MGVNFQSSEEIFNALEDIDEEILACFDVLSRLRPPDVTKSRTSK
jgi:hypothetical protein